MPSQQLLRTEDCGSKHHPNNRTDFTQNLDLITTKSPVVRTPAIADAHAILSLLFCNSLTPVRIGIMNHEHKIIVFADLELPESNWFQRINAQSNHRTNIKSYHISSYNFKNHIKSFYIISSSIEDHHVML